MRSRFARSMSGAGVRACHRLKARSAAADGRRRPRRAGRLAHHALLLSLLLVLVPAALAQSIGPDAAGYNATSATTYSFINVVSTGTRVLAGADDDTALLDLGFSFYFYGHAFTSVCVSSNGLLSFGGCNANDFSNQDLTAVAPVGNFPTIAPFWMDLTFSAPGADAVYYQTMGTAGNRLFVAQWNSAFPVNTTKGFTFQVVLAETSNNILFQYLTVDGGSTVAASLGGLATVGIRDTDGQSNGRRLQWSHAAPVLANHEAILFSSAVASDFSLSVDPAQQTVAAGDPATLTVTLNPTGGFSGPVTLGCSGLPAGASCSFSLSPITTGASTLTLSTAVSTPGGPLSFQVTGTSGTFSHSTTANLTVTARQGSIFCASVIGTPGSTVRVPLNVSMLGSASFNTVMLRVIVTKNGAAPNLDTAIDFEPATGLDAPGLKDLGGTLNNMNLAWLSPFSQGPLSGSATLGKVVVKIPASALNAQTYTISVASVSAASGETELSLALGPPATITVTTITYLVGDPYPTPSTSGDLNADGDFNDAGEFGNDQLTILDLVMALRASTLMPGYIVPTCSDRFDAMDSSPVDTDTTRGGNGQLTVLDLIITLRRSLLFDTSRPRRASRGVPCPTGGSPGTGGYTLLAAPDRETQAARDSRASELRLEANRPATPGRSVRIPIYLVASRNMNLAGMSFGLGLDGARVSFVAAGVQPALIDTGVPGNLAVAWLDGLSVRRGRLLLGYVQVESDRPVSPEALVFFRAEAVEANTNRAIAIQVPQTGGAGGVKQ